MVAFFDELASQYIDSLGIAHNIDSNSLFILDILFGEENCLSVIPNMYTL